VVVYVRWIAFVGGNHSIEVVLDDFHCHGCRDRAAVATVLDQNCEGDARLGRGREPDEPGVVYALVGQWRAAWACQSFLGIQVWTHATLRER